MWNNDWWGSGKRGDFGRGLEIIWVVRGEAIIRVSKLSYLNWSAFAKKTLL